MKKTTSVQRSFCDEIHPTPPSAPEGRTLPAGKGHGEGLEVPVSARLCPGISPRGPRPRSSGSTAGRERSRRSPRPLPPRLCRGGRSRTPRQGPSVEIAASCRWHRARCAPQSEQLTPMSPYVPVLAQPGPVVTHTCPPRAPNTKPAPRRPPAPPPAPLPGAAALAGFVCVPAGRIGTGAPREGWAHPGSCASPFRGTAWGSLLHPGAPPADTRPWARSAAPGAAGSNVG